jgi:hypothetical protein
MCGAEFPVQSEDLRALPVQEEAFEFKTRVAKSNSRAIVMQGGVS